MQTFNQKSLLKNPQQFTTQMSGSITRSEFMHIYFPSAIINVVTAAPTISSPEEALANLAKLFSTCLIICLSSLFGFIVSYVATLHSLNHFHKCNVIITYTTDGQC